MPTALLSSEFAACKVGVRTHFLMNQLYGKSKTTAAPPAFTLPQEGPRNHLPRQLKINQSGATLSNGQPQTRPQAAQAPLAAAGAQAPTLPRLTAGLIGIRTQPTSVLTASLARPWLAAKAGTTWAAQVSRMAAQTGPTGQVRSVQEAEPNTHDETPPPLPTTPSPPRVFLYAQQHMFAPSDHPVPTASLTDTSATVSSSPNVSLIPLPAPLPDGALATTAAAAMVTVPLSASPTPTEPVASRASSTGASLPTPVPKPATNASKAGSDPATTGGSVAPPKVVAVLRKKEVALLPRTAATSSGMTNRRAKVTQVASEASTAARVFSSNTVLLPSWARRAEQVQQEPGKPVSTPAFREAAAVRMSGTQSTLMSLLEQRDAMIARADARAMRSQDQATCAAQVQRDAINLINELKAKHQLDAPGLSSNPRIRMVDGMAVPMLRARQNTPEKAHESAKEIAADVAEQVEQDPPTRLFSTTSGVALKSALRSQSASVVRSPGKAHVRFSDELVMKGHDDQGDEVDSDYGSDSSSTASLQNSPSGTASRHAAEPHAPQRVHFFGPRLR